ncbi:hypothetical protein [Methylomonas sp. DH-1]|uniref:hypothetical protein n=1 Tax=Methylomonas sp. (strain DH-1) TaxID=1727196 RepID=UPI0007C8F70F|nr:hypothetical protein [Methylomonas sp. DH-1]ANE54045.1 hypothetical protein AYM39_01825 [Methylomonas sp. DH-1]
MRIELNKYQRAALFVTAAVIVFVQFAQFDHEGFEGYGWAFSFLIAGGLIVVGLAKNSRFDFLAKAPVQSIVLPSKDELEAGYAVLRENAEVLAVEVEQRANMLADALIKEENEMTKGLVHTIQGSKELGDKFVEQLNMHIRERCIYLMLGLVGMRRSKGNKMYITGIEFKTLQEKIYKKLIEVAVASHRLMPVPMEINTEALSTAMLEDIQQIRKTITQYCVACESKLPDPETSLLEWFESKCGLKIKGNPQISQVLFQDNANP